jgi:hypothetical protein
MKILSRLIVVLAVAGLIFPVLPNTSEASNKPLTITSPLVLPTGVVGKPYTYQFKAKGGQGPYTWSLGSQPANVYHCCLIALHPNGKFTSKGTGDSQMPYSGNFEIAVKVTDKNGNSVEQVSSYRIASAGSMSTKYKAGKVEQISATNISGYAYDNDKAVEVKMVIQEVGKKRKKTYKFEATPDIMRPEIGSYLSEKFAIGGILTPLGFSFDPSAKITQPGTYKIKSIKYNKNKFEFGVDAKTTFTIQ